MEKKLKHRTKELRLGDFTKSEGKKQISFDKPKIKTKEEIKREKEAAKKEQKIKEYYIQKKATGVLVSGIHLPQNINMGSHF